MSLSYYAWQIHEAKRHRQQEREDAAKLRRNYTPLLVTPMAAVPDCVDPPFRRDISQLPQLGSLSFGDVEGSPESFRNDLVRCASRLVAFSGDADIVMVGRSPESLFDLLTGLFSGTSWAERVVLLPFSKWYLWRGTSGPDPKALAAYYAVLDQYGLTPHQIAAPSHRPVAFADIVASGHTFHCLIRLLHRYAVDTGVDWLAVRRKIRLVAICRQDQTSPHTWRWQQHSPWLRELLSGGIVKDVSVGSELYHYLADYQQKTTDSYTPDRWGKRIAPSSWHDRPHLDSLRLARSVFETGQAKQTRREFASLLAREHEMRHAWLRGLVLELRSLKV